MRLTQIAGLLGQGAFQITHRIHDAFRRLGIGRARTEPGVDPRGADHDDLSLDAIQNRDDRRAQHNRIRQAQREAATAALRREIAAFVAGPITEEELEDARQYLLGSYAFVFETAAGTASQLAHLRRLGMPLDYVETFVERVAETSLEDVQAAVRRHLHPDRLIEVATVRA